MYYLIGINVLNIKEEQTQERGKYYIKNSPWSV